MSISLTLIPLALALTVVRGKDRTTEIVRQKEIPLKANLAEEKEVIETMQRCGFQTEKAGSRLKTELGDGHFFFWEKRGGAWHALFSVYDPAPVVHGFMKTVHERAGRIIFEDAGEQTAVEERTEGIEAGHEFHGPGAGTSGLGGEKTASFQTNFRDRALLEQVLRDNGMEPVDLGDGNIKVELADAALIFKQEAPGDTITVEISSETDMRTIFRHLAIVDDEYKRYVQNQVYEHLLQQVEQRGLVIEQEEVLDDHSILLTINLE